MKFLFALILFFSSSTLFAAPSAHRDPSRDAETYYPIHPQSQFSAGSAFNRKQALANLNLESVPLVSGADFVESGFKSVRDQRFLKSDDNADFPRRLTWLFPDDGCYARAEMAARILDKQNVLKPAKVFIFGNLHAETPNAPYGEVNWWYHVAIAYRTTDGVFILDPAIESKKPLLLADWVGRISSPNREPKLSICAAETFEPDSQCQTAIPIGAEKARTEAERFLPAEWNRLLELNRNPERELGDFPPWL